MNSIENILIALHSIKANLLRAILTLFIIAVGISCLVGMLTAIDTVILSLGENFNSMGANALTIYPANQEMRSRRRGVSTKISDPILFSQAKQFKKRFEYPEALVSVYTRCSSRAEITYKNNRTNPNCQITGIDEYYLQATSFDIGVGRNFTKNEISNGDHKALIGADIVDRLFNKDKDFALGKTINVGNTKYKIIGVLASKGSSMSQSDDRKVFIPLLNAKRYYGYPDKNYRIIATIPDATLMEDLSQEVIGTMRNVRMLAAHEKNDFVIRKSSGIIQKLKEVTTEIRWTTIAIALITLFGAAIGLMNIMLVSVTERTREIGVRKALGATRSNIMYQFLFEAIVITILGGIVGIILGIIVGLLVAKLIGGTFLIPFNWIALGIFVCIVVGTLSGLYPALKASKLDPIESLRHE